MENMKRAISAFLALVLVLGMVPGVPMFASAEEVESMPETMAVETTAAATEETTEPVTEAAEQELPDSTGETTIPGESVPETTGASETEPVETVPETTETQETEPVETEPQETIPQETVPEETVPGETVPEETTEELSASAEAMDAKAEQPAVTSIIISAQDNKTRTYVGDRIILQAKVLPENAWNKEVVFRVLDSYDAEPDYAPGAYDEELLAKGVLEAFEPGMYAIVADSAPRDPDGEDYTYEGDEDAEPFWVEFMDYTMKINTDAVEKENWYAGDDGEHGTDDDELKVMIHNTLELDVHYRIPAPADSDKDYEVIVPVPTPNIEWYLEEGDEAYAELIPSSNPKHITVRAKEVSETKTITLYAVDRGLWNGDMTTGVDYVQILVYPKPYKIGIYKDGEEILDGEEIIVDLNNFELESEFTLEAVVWPEEAEETLKWTVSDKKVFLEHDKITEKPLVYDTTNAKVTAEPYAGSSTITVSSTNYSNIKTKVIVKRRALVPGIVLSKASAQIDSLVAGQSAKFVALDARDDEILDSKIVKWELSAEDQEYATISKDGKLTAKSNLHIGKTVTVLCSVIDNELEANLIHSVRIHPKATQVEILGGIPESGEDSIVDGSVLNGMTLPVSTNAGRLPFKLGVKLYPQAEEDGEIGAKQDVTWTSSNKSIATIDPYTDEICWQGRNGLVTITATAADGSRKSASVKLQFGIMVDLDGMEIDFRKDSDDFFLRSGSSWTFGVKFNQSQQPTNKKVTWSLVDPEDSKYVTLSTSGRLTVKTIYEYRNVTIRATAQDGSEAFVETTISIRPKQDGMISLICDGVNVTKGTVSKAVGDTFALEAYTMTPDGDMPESVTWKSSRPGVIYVDENGDAAVMGVGSASITATADDGSRRSATVTVKGIQLADAVEFTHTHNQHALASGKSVTLKARAYYEENGKKKTPTQSALRWYIEEGGEAYATVSSSGKVTAVSGYMGEPVTITVVAETTDGSQEYAFARWEMEIAPAAQGVQILLNGFESSKYSFGLRKPATKDSSGEFLTLSSKVYPANASGFVNWTSSNTKVADFARDEDGNVLVNGNGEVELECKKAGTVTLTATAGDGTGKKATFRLTIVHLPVSVTFDNAFSVAGGKNLTFKPTFWDANGDKVTGKSLEWFLSDVEGDEVDGTAFCNLTSSGVLRTQKVTERKAVEVKVRTKEQFEDWEFESELQTVYIGPATTAVQIWEYDDVASNETWGRVDEYKILSAIALPYDAGMEFTWKTSNAKIADFVRENDDPKGAVVIDDNGNVTLVCHKPGTVVITATARDGTNKSDKLTVRIIN